MSAQRSPILLTDLQRCPRCLRDVLLLAPTVLGRVCTVCYVELGRPEPVSTRTMHEARVETIRRMQRRKGAAAAAVRKGV